MNQSKNILLDATIGPTFFFKEMFFLLILSALNQFDAQIPYS